MSRNHSEKRKKAVRTGSAPLRPEMSANASTKTRKPPVESVLTTKLLSGASSSASTSIGSQQEPMVFESGIADCHMPSFDVDAFSYGSSSASTRAWYSSACVRSVSPRRYSSHGKRSKHGRNRCRIVSSTSASTGFHRGRPVASGTGCRDQRSWTVVPIRGYCSSLQASISVHQRFPSSTKALASLLVHRQSGI